MEFTAIQTRSYPAEHTVSSPDLPEATAMFQGPGAAERATDYAKFMNGELPSEQPA